MSMDRFEALRTTVLQKAALRQIIDVYALALEFRDSYPECSEIELVKVVSAMVASAPGVTAVWLKTTASV